MDDAPSTEDLDLASATSQGELAEFLRTVYLRADKPSFRSLEARTRHDSTPLSKTVVSEMLRGVRFPKKAVMLSFLRACGVPDDNVTRWSRAWERIAELTQDSRRPPGPTGQVRAAPSSGGPRQDLPDDAPAESASNGPAADIVNPQIELFRSRIDKLQADNRRLRLRLTALGPQQAGQEPRAEEPAGLRTPHSPIASRRELGALLHALRVQKGLTVRQVAGRLMCSEDKVRRMEANFRAGMPRDVRDLCDLYGVTDEAERDRMIALAVEGKQQAWWQSYDLSYETYVGLEADALVISAFQRILILNHEQRGEQERLMSQPDQIADGPQWRKARHSVNDGACVEVAFVNGQIAVRDSKDPGGFWLWYSLRSWRDFTSNLRVLPRFQRSECSGAHPLRPWRGKSSGRSVMGSGRAGPGTWSRRQGSHTGARLANWYGRGIAGLSSSRATA
jgi:transcriptional regulator with XRE-family HTH domain